MCENAISLLLKKKTKWGPVLDLNEPCTKLTEPFSNLNESCAKLNELSSKIKIEDHSNLSDTSTSTIENDQDESKLCIRRPKKQKLIIKEITAVKARISNGENKENSGDSVSLEDENLHSGLVDAQGYYRCRISEVIDQRYRVMSMLGQGVFSTVVRCISLSSDETKEDGTVAVKIIRQKGCADSVGESEVAILRQLSAKPDSAEDQQVSRSRSQPVRPAFRPLGSGLCVVGSGRLR